MSHYRGYFIKDDHIVAPAVIDATDDAQAILKASELLSASHFPSIEVWQATRVVGALSALAPSDENVTKDGPHSSKGDVSNIADLRSRRRGRVHAETLTLQRSLPDGAAQDCREGEKKDGE